MENINLYHGTDAESADRIKAANCLISNDPKIIGPSVCSSLSKAVDFAIKKGGAEGKIIIIENVPETVLAAATKEAAEVFTLNDEFNQPLKRFCFQHAKTITVEEARLIMKQQPKPLKEKVYVKKK